MRTHTTPVSDVAPPQPIIIAANVVAEMMKLLENISYVATGLRVLNHTPSTPMA